MNSEKGFIHIYCGDGKGKTTAALGLAVRAAGAGKRVHFVQFLKGNPTSELEALKLIPNITVERPHKGFGFTWEMNDEQKRELTEIHNSLLLSAYEKMASGNIDMLIIDEFCGAYNKGLLDKNIADRVFFERPFFCELIITGREPEEQFIKAADYVSEIISRKHPFENGVMARKGIEF
ncbi:MAG: cob(I)yrinic acid a,c-diamide adenosyltransferase [Oscillospiraceae bacterium]|nr:cob(I)yrinic acid a,c-diamide adenosyltransferase [Oscillospiraceae bacterium]